SGLPTVAAEEGLTGLWQTSDSVGHVGSLHNELSSRLVNELETEGRCVITDHQAFVLLNTYCPALASADRLEYKLQFHALIEDRVKALRDAGKRVIVVCWNTQTGARKTNYGTRIDYILVDPAFLECVYSCSIEPERLGSDHCPVMMSCTVELKTDASTNVGNPAALCAKNFVEFSGTQQSIKAFVSCWG
uniref:Endonuclease/exonuclease/phosphatase domain-containing protein n=1 Tax=Phytophthora ramorum TaxID=164328 RepID=H3HAX1_PHYRM